MAFAKPLTRINVSSRSISWKVLHGAPSQSWNLPVEFRAVQSVLRAMLCSCALLSSMFRRCGENLPTGWNPRKVGASCHVSRSCQFGFWRIASCLVAWPLRQFANLGMMSPDERVQTPYSLTVLRPDLSKPFPKCGAVQVTFNTTGSLLLVRFESTPNAVHLYSFPSPSDTQEGGGVLAPQLKTVLIHSKPVLTAAWNPVRKGNLALCCGGAGMYLWSD